MTQGSKRKREDPELRGRAILETAAKLICAKGYAATGMQEIAEACGLTKAGLYHYIESKENLLLAIMSYGMDVFDEQVLLQVVGIEDPLERLRACMAKNIALVTDGWSKEIIIILHEHATLTGLPGKQINARKKRYVRFLESSVQEAIDRGQVRRVDPTLAAYSFLGTVLWIYKWYLPEGKLSAEQVSEGLIDLYFRGLELPS